MTLDLSRIRAITLDLDDTLWPVWPTIRKAEAALHDWLSTNAPNTAALLETPETMRGKRDALLLEFPHMAHDFSFMRQEAIRRALLAGGDDPAHAKTAFEVFFEARHQVELFEDALPALEYLAARYPHRQARSPHFQSRRHCRRRPACPSLARRRRRSPRRPRRPTSRHARRLAQPRSHRLAARRS